MLSSRVSVVRLIVFLFIVKGTTATVFAQDDDSKLMMDYRRRMSEGRSYQPLYLDPLICTYLSDEACEEKDLLFHANAEAGKRILNPTVPSQGFNSPQPRQSTTGAAKDLSGTFELLILPIVWQDHQDRALIPREDLEAMLCGEGVDEDLYPGGSMRNWTTVNSHGTVDLKCTVVDYFVSEFTEAQMADGRQAIPNGNFPDFATDAITPALQKLDAEFFDFLPFDQDQNFRIDSILVLHSGYPGEFGDTTCNGVQSRGLNRIRSIAAAGDSFRGRNTIIAMGNYAVASIYRGICSENQARIGVMTHEFLHTVGLPDLYDRDGTPNPGVVGGMGAFDIMSDPSGQSGRQARPGHLSAWTKMELGWATPQEVTQDGVYTLRPSALSPDYLLISAPYQENEYLLIENRGAQFFDEAIWDGGGVTIYHIDLNGYTSGNFNRGGTFQADWPGNGNHFPIAVVQADGLFELEQAINKGDAGDFFKEGSVLGPGNGETRNSPQGTYPNTDSYANGQVIVTGLTIDQFTEVEPGVWSMRITGLGLTIEPGVPTASPPVAPTTPGVPTSSPPVAPTTPSGPTASPPVAPTPTDSSSTKNSLGHMFAFTLFSLVVVIL